MLLSGLTTSELFCGYSFLLAWHVHFLSMLFTFWHLFTSYLFLSLNYYYARNTLFFCFKMMFSIILVLGIILNSSPFCGGLGARFWDPYAYEYGYFDDAKRRELLETTRQMFYFGYDNYLKYAFPKDELDPIHCTGRGPDYDNPWVVAKILCCSATRGLLI